MPTTTVSRGFLVTLVPLLVVITSAKSSPSAEPPRGPDPSPDEWENDARTMIALIAAAFACALSLAAGVGGGGVLVPIFNLILGLGIKQSTGLSQAVIAAAGIGSTAFSLTHAHPLFPWRPLIDFNLVLVLTPALLLGISFGVLFNGLCPGWLVTIIIVVVLTYASQRTFRFAVKLQRAEQQAAALKVLEWTRSDFTDDANNNGYAVNGDVHEPLLTSPGRKWARPDLPWTQIGQLLTLWAVFILLQLGKSKFGRCSVPYFAFYALQAVVAVTATIYCVRKAVEAAEDWAHENWHVAHQAPLLSDDERLSEGHLNGVNGDDSDVDDGGAPHTHHHHQQQQQQQPLTKEKLEVAAASAVGAGVLAGLIGMGGGFILNPLLLELGIHPQVAAATSSLMVLFSSSSATVAFIAGRTLNMKLAAIFGAFCCVSAFCGVYMLANVVKKRGASAVVFLLAGIIAMGAAATLVFDGSKVWHQITSGEVSGFQPFCQPSEGLDVGVDYIGAAAGMNFAF